MDNTIRILAIGYDEPIMKVVSRLIDSHGNWQGTVAMSREDGMLKLQSGFYDVVLLCVGVTEDDEAALNQVMTISNPDAKLIRHFGGGSGLLENELRAVFDKK
ncbi:hypothetical protein [Chitinophaga sp. HK235]|uniref:hypothetical protein n=1 Tax=Chitinophaga sp. HK235 TaxID=2952571 RepID=UPI001BACABBF|nr:hypothetical protein [Chitinophaga sp. HK235]